MFEVYKCLCDAANAYWLAGGNINNLIGCILYAFAVWYMMHVISIPFYIKEIAMNTRRGR